MPPRRSARAVSGSTAPAAPAGASAGASTSKSTTSKGRAVSSRRKAASPSPAPENDDDEDDEEESGQLRGDAAEDDDDDDEAFPGESDEEPAPRKRGAASKAAPAITKAKGASKSASKPDSRASTRAPAKGSAKTVPKKRISDEVGVEVDEGSKKAARTRTSAASAAGRTSAVSATGTSKRAGESISDDSASPKPKRPAAKGRSTATGRGKSKAPAKAVSESSEDEDEEAGTAAGDGVEDHGDAATDVEAEEETVKPTSSKGRSKVVKQEPVSDDEDGDDAEAEAAVQAALDEDDEDDEDEEDDATPAPKKPSSATIRPATTVESNHEDDEADKTPSKPVKPAPGTPARIRAKQAEDDEHANSTPDFAHIPHPTAARPFPTPTPARLGSDLNGQTLPGSQATPSRVPPTPAVPFAPPPVAKPKPRLTIHKLVLVNFKSYAGRQEIGPFHKSFSAIVGPNGSGKSNTIDALLFVFGYRASKMRQGKLSELIHNSAGKEGLESCSVEVWFREIVDMPGVDNFKLVPNSQLVVTRTAYRNNSSQYSINDMRSTFGEVTTLLKGKGIDLDHNRFLILQGEVESIAQMKAKAGNEHEDGLLEYLEDIIGTTKYKEPIEEAAKAVEELNEKRGEKMNRLRIVEAEKKALEDRKKEAEGFLRDRNELMRKRSLLWQFYMYTLGNNLEVTSKAVESLTGQLEEESAKNAGLLADIERLTTEYNEKLQAYNEVQRLTEALVKDAKKFEKEEVGLQEKKKHQVAKQKKLKKSIADDGHAKSEAASAVENHSSELETNRAKVAKLETKLVDEEAELEEIRDSLKDKTDQFTVQIEAKQRELEPWTAKINEKQSSIDVAKSERDALVEKASGAAAALQEAKDNLEKLQSGGEGKANELERYKAELKTAKRDLEKAEAKLSGMGEKAEALKSKATNARGKADEAKSSMAADRSENAVLTSLNKLKAQGRIKGFHGRLGDLGTIDDKYDVAVTTACGALNNLVVDTVEQGQACIEHLRKGNVGRASFMVLEKLPPRDLGRIQTPENVPRLFDLIKFKDPRFAPAFYKGVFNTLVADDLVQAQRIGYGAKRWRVVTLAGQLIDPSGTMSGGGTRVQRGGMSSKLKADAVGPEVVMRYEQERDTAEAEYMEYIRDRKRVDEEVQRLRARVPEIEVEIEKIGMDVANGGKRVREAEKRLAEVTAQSRPDAADEKRIKTLNSEIDALEAEVAKLKTKSSGISDQIKELQNKILEVGGVKLRAIQSKVTTTKGLLDLANESITKAEVGQAKSQRDVEKLGRAIEANKVKLEECERELEAVETDLAAAQADRSAIQAKVQEAKDAHEDVKESMEESKRELEEHNEEINVFRKLEVDIKQKMEDHKRALREDTKKLEYYRKRHEGLELEYVDEDDEDDVEEEEQLGEEPVEPVEGEEAEGEPRPKAAKKKSGKNSMELDEYSPDELRGVDKEMLSAEITQLEEDTSKQPNMNVLAEYRKREAEFLNRASDMETTTNERDAAKKRYDELRKVRLDEFMAGFSAISAKLKEMYQMITMGGNAEIELIDSMDPFSEGVVLSIMPPKKSWRAIANLSGGEKTLASLALVFALHVFKPTPLYFMDEIDAALDFKNVSIVANYIQSKTQAAQFIVISLRNDMFELAHRLVGIYKTSNCTKSVAIDNKDLRTQAVPRPRRPLGPGATAGPMSPERRMTGPRQTQQGGPGGLAVPGTMRKLSATPSGGLAGMSTPVPGAKGLGRVASG